jgi:hypothetical protein
MRFSYFLAMTLFTSACSAAADKPSTNPTTTTPSDIVAIAKSYTTLRSMTDAPVYVDPGIAALCRGLTQSDVDEAKRRSGPHADATIRIYMSARAADAFLSSAVLYPVGSVIIKEKKAQGLLGRDGAGAKATDGVGGMVKRQPGYDSEHGDWEYFYFESAEKIESGKIASCVRCHAAASKKDYVFGDWSRNAGPSTRPSPSTQRAAATRAATTQPDLKQTARAIDAILYSELSNEQMLEKLAPFVAVMDSVDDFKRKTGLAFADGIGSGPGVMDFAVQGCGLHLVIDPDNNIRIIRRDSRTAGGRVYSQMSISDQGFTWGGYSRWYPN